MYAPAIADNAEALLSGSFVTAPSSPASREKNHVHGCPVPDDDLDSSDDFDFSARSSDAGVHGYASTTTSPMSSAEDLFLNGKIRPLNHHHLGKLGAQDCYYSYCPELEEVRGHEKKKSSVDITLSHDDDIMPNRRPHRHRDICYVIMPCHHCVDDIIMPCHLHHRRGREVAHMGPNHDYDVTMPNYGLGLDIGRVSCRHRDVDVRRITPKHSGEMVRTMPTHPREVKHITLNHGAHEMRHDVKLNRNGNGKHINMHPYDDDDGGDDGNDDVEDIDMHPHCHDGDSKGIAMHGNDGKGMDRHACYRHHSDPRQMMGVPYHGRRSITPRCDEAKKGMPCHQHCVCTTHHRDLRRFCRCQHWLIKTGMHGRNNIHVHAHRRARSHSPVKILHRNEVTARARPRYSFENLIHTDSYDFPNVPRPIKRTLKDLLGDDKVQGCSMFASSHHQYACSPRPPEEPMRKKPFIPFRRGLLACLGFTSKSYSSMKGHRVLK